MKTVVANTAANDRKIQHRDGFHQRTPHGGDKCNSTRRCSVYTNALMASNRPRGSGDRLSRTSSNNKTSRRERLTPRLFFHTKESKKMFLIIRLTTESSSATRKDNFKTTLRDNFQIRSYPMERFVGITIDRDRAQRRINRFQPDYNNPIVEKIQIAAFPVIRPGSPRNLLDQFVDGKIFYAFP